MPPPMAPPIRAPGGDPNDPDRGKPYFYALQVRSLRDNVIAACQLQGPNAAAEFQQIFTANARKAKAMFGDQVYQLTWYAEYHTAFEIAQKVGIKYSINDFGIPMPPPMTQGQIEALMARRAAARASASSSNVAASSGVTAPVSPAVAALSGSAASSNVAASSDAVAKAAGQASQSLNSSKSKTHGIISSSQVAPEGAVSDEGQTEGRIPRTPTHIFHGENKPTPPLGVNERPQFSAHCTARNAFSGFIGHDQERAM
ncbi:hypothetical protein HYFRA_00012261 [Hymenoscyphus fraxineus]|uniref:Uncharacterized protein n=1 Tax=Hymenoscyphus fraxineus TaxID=746836 RepID=A0A9N9L357_9HELO|nr:hypothetical protein HYFRA_00012261 [Hymenoscyphus fraxineus]